MFRPVLLCAWSFENVAGVLRWVDISKMKGVKTNRYISSVAVKVFL